MSGPKVLSLGEALVDVVHQDGNSAEHVGGSLLNVGCGLARLGHDVTIGTWFGRDERGGRIVEWARTAGARLHEGSDGAEHTSVAYATLDAAGSASYDFDLTWKLPALADLDDVNHLHTGSIAATLEPGGTQVLEAVRAARDHATVSYDPNARPALMHSPQAVMQRIEELVSLADLVKASEEDIEWLYGDKPLQAVMRHWRALGPAMVVITRGPWGAWATLGSDRDMLVVDQLNVKVADTVGAGDSFMAGLISGLLEADLLGGARQRGRLRQARWADVQPALHRAAVTSGLTVSRAGSYAPDRAEVEAMLAHPPDFD
ncbi:carbohydrate kinase [Arthrobacter sp. I2-34]|uniref:Carbohydrate kinase n=1 Tax=Arthrobacter hankyongi TaxID=2904801 RepID=A0ABS9LCB9_9MICC|nr:carbohydrate kinase [Arthrobacter hankyongi]MCG2624327.1 carbohydrate kinase [Arthrobacter hankyongi]